MFLVGFRILGVLHGIEHDTKTALATVKIKSNVYEMFICSLSMKQNLFVFPFVYA